MIKAVIFDWGGVIAPIPNGGWLGSLSIMMNIPIDELLPHYLVAGYKDFCRGIISEAEFYQRFEASFGSSLPDDVSRIWIDGSAFNPYPEMLTFVRQLKNSNYTVCLLSNTVKPMSNILRQKGFYNEFQPVILSDEVGLTKPDTSIYQMILDQLRLSANECIYIDDAPNNLEPAKELGMFTILASDDPIETINSIRQALEAKR